MKKLVAVFLILSLIAVCFAGCCPKNASYEVPVEIYERYGEKGGVGASYDLVRLFFDNTYSLFGYLMEGTGKASGYNTVISRLTEIMNKYNTEEYYCMRDAGGKSTEWTQISEDDFMSQYKKEQFFFVFNELSSPFDSENVDFTKGLNVYITDLAEGAAVNKALAEKLNENIISGEERSALLYCFLVNYHGLNSVDHPDVLNEEGDVNQSHEEINLKDKPFYVIVSGPTKEIVTFYNEFNAEVESAGFKLGENYFFEKFLSGRGLSAGECALRTEDFAVTEASLESDVLSKYYTFDNTDLNFDMELVEYNDVFKDLHQKLPGLFIKATSVQAVNLSGDDQFARRFSFVVDLPQAKATAVDYELGVDNVYFANESTAVSYQNETQSEGEEAETTELEQFSQMSKDDVFELLDSDNTKRLMNVEYAVFDEEISAKRIDEKVLQENESKKLKDVEPDFTIKPNPAGGTSVVVTLTVPGSKTLQDTYDALLLCFSVKGIAEGTDDIPEWIGRFDSSMAKSENRYNINKCAEDLKYIYQYLNGSMANENLKQQYSEYMVTTVCSFPVLIDFSGVD